MKIIIKSTNIKLSPSINQYIEEKIGGLEKFLKKYNPELVEARVEVGKITRGQRQGDIFKAEVNLSINGQLIRVERTEESLMAAIDLVKDELHREIRQRKDKRMTMAIRGARSWKKFWRISPLARFRSSKISKFIKRK
jgi:putative sigma-54 modulation protein